MRACFLNVKCKDAKASIKSGDALMTWPFRWYDRATPFLTHLFLLVGSSDFLMSQYRPPKEHKDID